MSCPGSTVSFMAFQMFALIYVFVALKKSPNLYQLSNEKSTFISINLIKIKILRLLTGHGNGNNLFIQHSVLIIWDVLGFLLPQFPPH